LSNSPAADKQILPQIPPFFGRRVGLIGDGVRVPPVQDFRPRVVAQVPSPLWQLGKFAL
jgi:hypothetical protein